MPSTTIKTSIGDANPVLFASGEIGFQITTDARLTALINEKGAIGENHSFGNNRWETCPLSPRHRMILQKVVDNNQFSATGPITVEGFVPTPIPGV